MYGDIVREHATNPRNQGPLSNATHHGCGGKPGEGPFICFSFAVSMGTILRCGFESSHCPAAIAMGSVTTILLTGRKISVAEKLTADDIERILGGLPETKQHLPRLAVEAIKTAFVEELMSL